MMKFSPQNKNKRSASAGRSLLEMIMSLSLLMMVSGVLFMRQASQQRQVEEVAVADGIRQLRNKLKVYVRNNTGSLRLPVNFVKVSDFIDNPPEIYDGFNIVILKDDVPPGVQRNPYHGFIVSPDTIKKQKLTDMSAARIAAMLGASGGFIGEHIGATGTAQGTMALWKLDNMEEYFGAEQLTPPRIVVNLDFADINNDLSPDMMQNIMFRRRVEGFPEASNGMEWDLRFVKDGANTLIIGADGSIRQTTGNFTVEPNGSISSKGTLSIAGNASFASNVSVAGSQTIGADLSVAGSQTVGVNLSVERDLTVGRNETVGSNLTVRGNESVSGNSSVGGNASVSGYLNVGVDADIGRYLDVGRDVNVGRNVKAEGYVSAGGVVESLLVRDQGEPCDAGQIARDESGNTLLCSSGVWTDALCEASRRMGQQLFTRDTFFKAPCTGDYTITVIGAGAGGEDAYTSDNSSTNCVHSVCPPDKDTTYSLSCGEDSCDLYSYTRTTNKCLCVDGKVLYNDGTGAGGSSAFYGPDTAKTILIIGGGGNGILGQNGQTGRMTQKMVKLEKDKIYTIKVGQPGQGDYGGTGYHDGQSGYPSRMATASGGDSTQGSQCPAFSGCGGYGAQGQKGFSRGQTEAHGSQGAVLVRMEYAKCPTGYTLDGSVCARTYTATYTASGYYCSSASYTLDETVSPRVCNRTYAATYKSGSYSCPSGGTLSGSTCTITTTATYTSTHYYCPSGGTLTGTTCRITRSTLFNG